MKMATKKTTPPTKKAVNLKAAAPAATATKTSATAPKTAAPAPKPAVTSPEKKAAPVKKAANPSKPASAAAVHTVTPEARWQMISEAAYFLAEKRGFAGGNPCEDWVQAESQVDALLKQRAAGKK
jgi:hypothetical protein